jgi:hypothetical protein
MNMSSWTADGIYSLCVWIQGRRIYPQEKVAQQNYLIKQV